MTVVADGIKKIIDAGDVADAWVNGPPDKIINTPNGPLKSIAGINASILGDVLNAMSATSNSVVTIGAGTKTFLIGPGKGFKAGQIVTAVAPGGQYVSGAVKSYVDNTLVLDVLSFNGAGTAASWAIAFSGPPGKGGDSEGRLITKMPWEV